MSPTATIATVVVALLFFAWFFQSDARDPGFEAMQRRQQEQLKAGDAQKAAAGIAVTDSGVTKDNTPLGQRNGVAITGYDPSVIQGGIAEVDPPTGTLASAAAAVTTNANDVVYNTRPAFGKDLKLKGTYVAVNDDRSPDAGATPDPASIMFVADGTFSSQNMPPADPEPDANGVVPVERGSGKYTLSVNTLELTYTDGLTRKKGNKRAYTVVPVDGPDTAPTAIAIQGQVFKLDRPK
jgi:hypothetical protein